MKENDRLDNMPELMRALENKKNIEQHLSSINRLQVSDINKFANNEEVLRVKDALENNDVLHKLEGAKTLLYAISDVLNVMSLERPVIIENHRLLLKGIIGVLDQVPKFDTPFMSFMSGLLEASIIPYLSEMNRQFENGFKVNIYRKIYEGYMQQMHEVKWFPYVGGREDNQLLFDVFEIISKTRKGQSRIKKIDQRVYTYYTKEKVEKMRKSWRKKGIDYCRVKMLSQAVNAFHREEYALTIITMATMWEGIIKDKAREGVKKPIAYLKALQETGDIESVVVSYCEDFIFYQCYSIKELKEDVPGRNAIAHSWYKKYPSKKAALNAILFTDFLLNTELREEK